MARAIQPADVQAIAIMDLVLADCVQLTSRLNLLETYFDARSGNFDIQRAFVKEIAQQMVELRGRVSRELKEKAA